MKKGLRFKCTSIADFFASRFGGFFLPSLLPVFMFISRLNYWRRGGYLGRLVCMQIGIIRDFCANKKTDGYGKIMQLVYFLLGRSQQPSFFLSLRYRGKQLYRTEDLLKRARSQSIASKLRSVTLTPEY